MEGVDPDGPAVLEIRCGSESLAESTHQLVGGQKNKGEQKDGSEGGYNQGFFPAADGGSQRQGGHDQHTQKAGRKTHFGQRLQKSDKNKRGEGQGGTSFEGTQRRGIQTCVA